MSDYLPISLENVVSRIITKVIVNWLKIILPNVISDAQSAFTPNRLITNNTTVVFEVIHKMLNKRRGKKGKMVVKLDISKVYDWVEWAFFWKVMPKLGLDEKWVQLAMETVCTTTYLVLINGEPKGFVTPTTDVKQGDPLSPYLFLFCAQGLSTMLWKVEEARHLQGVLSNNGGVHLSHLLFANDSLIFCQATLEECPLLLAILEQYEATSRQAINRQKTSLFFSRNTRTYVKHNIRNIMVARIVEDCEKYLVLLMANGKSKVNKFKDLQEKIARRVMG